MVDGIAQKPIEGVSMVSTWDKGERQRPVDGAPHSTLRCSVTARSTTMAGLPPRTPPAPPWLMV